MHLTQFNQITPLIELGQKLLTLISVIFCKFKKFIKNQFIYADSKIHASMMKAKKRLTKFDNVCITHFQQIFVVHHFHAHCYAFMYLSL